MYPGVDPLSKLSKEKVVRVLGHSALLLELPEIFCSRENWRTGRVSKRTSKTAVFTEHASGTGSDTAGPSGGNVKK